MEVGAARHAEDKDFFALKDLCTCHDGWTKEYDKSGTTVWTKANDVSDFKMIKVRSVFKDISASTLYDVLHDSEYRKEWDTNMAEGREVCLLSPMNDIGYYALRTPKPLKMRDFVIQRSWLDNGVEYYIVNHSVNHRDFPPKKGIIRGISYITGYYIIPLDGRKQCDPGCMVTYVTQSDPKGKLPAFIVNKVTKIKAPKVMSSIAKACRGYKKWKIDNQPGFKPWIYPEQNTLPRLNPADIISIKEQLEAASADETNLSEADLEEFDPVANGK